MASHQVSVPSEPWRDQIPGNDKSGKQVPYSEEHGRANAGHCQARGGEHGHDPVCRAGRIVSAILAIVAAVAKVIFGEQSATRVKHTAAQIA
jgi:hypothetical protein